MDAEIRLWTKDRLCLTAIEAVSKKNGLFAFKGYDDAQETKLRNVEKRFDKLESSFHELKHENEKISEIAAKYKAIFERNLHCIYVHDFEGRFIDANDAALSLLGYKREEINNLSIYSLINEDQMQMALAAIKEIMQFGSQRQLTEYKVKTKNGSYVWIETDGGLIYREGKPHAIQGVARDITNRKMAAAALEESEKNYR